MGTIFKMGILSAVKRNNKIKLNYKRYTMGTIAETRGSTAPVVHVVLQSDKKINSINKKLPSTLGSTSNNEFRDGIDNVGDCLGKLLNGIPNDTINIQETISCGEIM